MTPECQCERASAWQTASERWWLLVIGRSVMRTHTFACRVSVDPRYEPACRLGAWFGSLKSGALRERPRPPRVLVALAPEPAVIVKPKRAVEVYLDLGPVGRRDGHLVAVAGHVGGHRPGAAAADGPDRSGLPLGGVGAGARLLQCLVRRGAMAWIVVPRMGCRRG